MPDFKPGAVRGPGENPWGKPQNPVVLQSFFSLDHWIRHLSFSTTIFGNFLEPYLEMSQRLEEHVCLGRNIQKLYIVVPRCQGF